MEWQIFLPSWELLISFLEFFSLRIEEFFSFALFVFFVFSLLFGSNRVRPSPSCFLLFNISLFVKVWSKESRRVYSSQSIFSLTTPPATLFPTQSGRELRKMTLDRWNWYLWRRWVGSDSWERCIWWSSEVHSSGGRKSTFAVIVFSQNRRNSNEGQSPHKALKLSKREWNPLYHVMTSFVFLVLVLSSP